MVAHGKRAQSSTCKSRKASYRLRYLSGAGGDTTFSGQCMKSAGKTGKTSAVSKSNTTSSVRPMPPAMFSDPLNMRFAPAPEVLTWARETFIGGEGPLHNPEHSHLEYAHIGFLWAPGGFNKQGRTVLGQCEQMTFRCGPWQKGRQQQQMADWFGGVPDFLITLDALYCLECSDADFCALVEHELYHIGQERDDFGQPAFTKFGLPKLGMRAHDVEEFVGVVRRYGPSDDVKRLIDAAKSAPEAGKHNIARACGTCLLKVA